MITGSVAGYGMIASMSFPTITRTSSTTGRYFNSRRSKTAARCSHQGQHHCQRRRSGKCGRYWKSTRSTVVSHCYPPPKKATSSLTRSNTMSLDWKIDQIENYKEVCWIETGEQHEDGEPKVRLNPVTEALIYNTISIDIGVITYDNAGEVYARTKILEAVNGCMLTKDGKESPMTIEDIRAHIGLWCNVSFKSRKEWAQRWFVGHGDYLVKHGMKRK